MTKEFSATKQVKQASDSDSDTHPLLLSLQNAVAMSKSYFYNKSKDHYKNRDGEDDERDSWRNHHDRRPSRMPRPYKNRNPNFRRYRSYEKKYNSPKNYPRYPDYTKETKYYHKPQNDEETETNDADKNNHHNSTKNNNETPNDYDDYENDKNITDHNNNHKDNHQHHDDTKYDEYEREYNNNDNKTPYRYEDVCKFYNPYFKSGCNNRRCPYAHMTKREFLSFISSPQINQEMTDKDLDTFKSARRIFEHGNISRAYYMVRPLVSFYEYNSTINFWMAKCNHFYPEPDLAQFQRAEYYYRRAICIAPNNSYYHHKYAQFLIEYAAKRKAPKRCREYKQARHHFHISLNLKDSANVHFTFAKFLDELEFDYKSAKYHYQKVIAEYPRNTRIRLNYARLLHKMDLLDESKRTFTEIFKYLKAEDPQYHKLERKWIWPHYHYARLLVDMSHYEQSREQFQICCDVMSIHDRNYWPDIYHEFSKLLFYRLNDCETAYYCINQAISLNPNRKHYQRLLFKIQEQMYRNPGRLKSSKSKSNRPYQPPAPRHLSNPPQFQQSKFRQSPSSQRKRRYLGPISPPRGDQSGGFKFGNANKQSNVVEFLQYVPSKGGHGGHGDSDGDRDGNVEEDNYGVPEEAPGTAFSFGFRHPVISKRSEREEEEEKHKERNKKTENVVEEEEEEDEAENEWLANRFCATEFDRFISSDDRFGDEFEAYFDKFEDENINDIRWLLNENAMNETFLIKKIGMSPFAVKLWKKAIQCFIKQHKRYVSWLKRNNFYTAYFKKFRIYGILHLKSFFYHVKNVDDVLYMIGEQNKRDALKIWTSAEREMSLIQREAINPYKKQNSCGSNDDDCYQKQQQQHQRQHQEQCVEEHKLESHR